MPEDAEILVCRLTDRPLRPVFPEGWLNETQVLLYCLSSDLEHNPEPLAINAAALSVLTSDIPFREPVAGVVVAVLDPKRAGKGRTSDEEEGDTSEEEEGEDREEEGGPGEAGDALATRVQKTEQEPSASASGPSSKNAATGAATSNFQFVLFPTTLQKKQASMVVLLAGTSAAVSMIEASSQKCFVPDSCFLEAVRVGHEFIKYLTHAMRDFQSHCGKPKRKIVGADGVAREGDAKLPADLVRDMELR